MQLKNTILPLAVALLLLAGGAMSAQESRAPEAHSNGHKAHKKNDGFIALSADLHHLLAEEMSAIQGGMSQLSSAIAAGNWDKIIKTAKKMEESYIIKQKLTTTQKEELAHKLPAGFKRLDKNFHETAGKLAHAAQMKNKQLVPFFYYKLTESCVNCHSIYAVKRFPELAEKNGAGHQH